MTDEIVEERRGPLLVLTLDRPRALNALSLAMCEALHAAYDRAAADDSVKAVVLRSSSEKAFCAGGDVRRVREHGHPPADERAAHPGRAYFAAEYAMNRALHHLDKPHVALIDGIVMGGGAGISIHGSHRVVSARVLFAMPECSIGFFPDIGGGWFLPRCPGETGIWLGLTGARLGGAGMLALGLATHGVPTERMGEVIDALAAADWSSGPAGAVADGAIAPLTGAVGTAAIERETIDRCFAAETVEEILARLDAEPGDFAREAAAAMRAGAPTSLKLALAQLRQGRTMPYDDVVRMEYRMACRILLAPNFFEGVRAAIVDRDRAPRWQPDRLDAVTDAAIAAYFAPLPPDAELPDQPESPTPSTSSITAA